MGPAAAAVPASVPGGVPSAKVDLPQRPTFPPKVPQQSRCQPTLPALASGSFRAHRADAAGSRRAPRYRLAAVAARRAALTNASVKADQHRNHSENTTAAGT